MQAFESFKVGVEGPKRTDSVLEMLPGALGKAVAQIPAAVVCPLLSFVCRCASI